MESQTDILLQLYELIGHEFIKLTDRGNSAITAALELIPSGKKLLIPAEGGWIHYQKAPEKLGIPVEEVACQEARIDLQDLSRRLATGEFGAFLYQNPGGYFAEQPLSEIYNLCQKHRCWVFLDLSGALGTSLSQGKHADLCLGSFGEDKLVNVGVGGWISCVSDTLFCKLVLPPFPEESFLLLAEKLRHLPQRISFLEEKRKKIMQDLSAFQIVHPYDKGFVVVIQYASQEEKEKIIDYCQKNTLPFTECPRYIRLNQKAISIEVKKLC